MQEQQPETSSALDRLIFLSDGVFAIAITLLVLEIAVPEISNITGPQLSSILIGLWPKILTYALSFIIIAVYWTTHQRIFYYIKRTTDVLTWLNVFLLMSIAFLPVPTNVVGMYGNHREAVIFYAISLMVAACFIVLIWWYATNGHRLVDKNLDPALIRHHIERSLIAPAVFLLAIILSFISPFLAEVSLLLIGVIIFIHERRYRRHTQSRL